MENNTTSNLLYSLAFLYQTTGSIRDAVTNLTANNKIFVYGISDKKVGGLDLQKPDVNVAPVYPSEIAKNLPEPFKSENATFESGYFESASQLRHVLRFIYPNILKILKLGSVLAT